MAHVYKHTNLDNIKYILKESKKITSCLYIDNNLFIYIATLDQKSIQATQILKKKPRSKTFVQ